jgi:hypothetical protein
MNSNEVHSPYLTYQNLVDSSAAMSSANPNLTQNQWSRAHMAFGGPGTVNVGSQPLFDFDNTIDVKEKGLRPNMTMKF